MGEHWNCFKRISAYIGLQGTSFNKLVLGNIKASGSKLAFEIPLHSTFHQQEVPEGKLFLTFAGISNKNKISWKICFTDTDLVLKVGAI